MGGKPFYFFKKQGALGTPRYGISYAGQEADLGYTNILHYQCCSGSVLNPWSAAKIVAFFAQQDGNWYYVEILAAGR